MDNPTQKNAGNNSEKRFQLRIEISAIELTNNEELNALTLLSKHSTLSKQKIKLACKHGAVWLTKQQITTRLRNATKPLKVGDALEIFYDEYLIGKALIKPILIKDEGNYSVWYKPQGLLSQGTQWGDFHSLLRFAEFNLLPQRPAFLVHRLDKDASGIMLIAHHKDIATKFSTKFSNRDIIKHYQAIVAGHFPQETITFDKTLNGKEALTVAKGLAYNEEKNISLVHIDLKTGRKHQIRQHLADFGFAIMGDKLYGNPNSKEQLQLCSIRLAFNYPNRLNLKEYSLDKQLMLIFP